MELRRGGHLHFMQAIKGGLVIKVPNVAHGRPKLMFKEVKDIYDGFVSCNELKAERSCFEVIEERTVKIEPDDSVCDANDSDDQRINNLDGDSFDNYTIKQIKECCQTRKRKHAQGLDSSKRKFKIEDSSSMEDCRKEQEAADDSDFMETLSSWKSKLSKNMKAKKKKCIKDPISTSIQEIMLVVKSEETQNSQEFPTSSEETQNGQEIPSSSEQIQNRQVISSSGGHSTALVEVKSEVPTDCFSRPYDYSVIEGKEEAEITYEWNLKNELNYEWQKCVDLIPLRIVRPSTMDIVISNSQLSSDKNSNFPAIEFDTEECTIHSDLHYISPELISFVEDCSSDIDNNQPDDDTDAPVSLPNVATHKDLDCIDLDSRNDNNQPDGDTDALASLPYVATHKDLDCIDLDCRDDKSILDDCRKDEFTTGAEDQVKLSPTIEHGPNPDECLVCHSDYSPEYEKRSFASINDDDDKSDTNDELTSLDEQYGSSKLHRPERLLSTRKSISPSSQERLCKAMESVDLNHKNYSKCRGKLYFTEQTNKKNGKTEELEDPTRAQFTDNPNKISVNPRTFKRISHPKVVSKIHSSRPATRLGCSTVQSCSKSAIAFTQQQMHDVECLAVKLTKELKSMKDIMDDMLRSEFCLNTSLRHKVNEARMAVKNATRAEEAAKRCLSFMARDCSRFCKIMKLADDGPPPQDVSRKERKKIAFADEAGGRLCQVRFYENDELSLPESK